MSQIWGSYHEHSLNAIKVLEKAQEFLPND